MNKVLIYCRESRDDNNENIERIELQAKMLIDYANNNNIGEIVDVILDDNKTGTNFKRLDPVKEMIINKKFNIFLCKDCSRIGRDLLESLKFIEFLKLHNIELIFLSEYYDEDIFPIKAWFNQLRAKDDSKKIQQVINNKKHEGTLLIKAPFGYIKSGNQLIPAKEYSTIVQEIFAMYISGRTVSFIANHLNESNVKTPSMLKPEYNSKTYTWNNQQILRILKNEIYTGKMVYNKFKKTKYSSKKYIKNIEEDWIIKENHHAPIINENDFYKAQKLLLSPKPRNVSTSIFSGKIYCGLCGEIMYRKLRKDYPVYYVCKNYNLYGKKSCSLIKVYEQDLVIEIKKYIKLFINSFNSSKLLKILSSENDINKNEEIKLKFEQKLLNLYEDKQNGYIDDFIFTNKKIEYQNRINECLVKLENNSNKLDYNTIRKSLEAKIDVVDLDLDIINIFIEKIEIHTNTQGQNFLFIKKT